MPRCQVPAFLVAHADTPTGPLFQSLAPVTCAFAFNGSRLRRSEAGPAFSWLAVLFMLSPSVSPATDGPNQANLERARKMEKRHHHEPQRHSSGYG